MSIFDTLADSGITQEDLEKAASARLFAEAAAAEGIDLSELSEDQAEELYAFWADDAEKTASANAFFEAAAAEGIDLEELTEDQVGELYNFWATGGEEVEKSASAEELLQEAAVKEASAKLAEAEYIGRYMARVYADELDKLADWKQTASNAASRVGDAFKAGRLRRAIGAHAANSHVGGGPVTEEFAKEFGKLRRSEMAKGLGESAAAYGGAAGLGYGAYRGGKKLLGKKSEGGEKQSSAFDEILDEAAIELLKEAGIIDNAARKARTFFGKQTMTDRALNARDAAVAGGRKAMEYVGKHKKEIGGGAALTGAGFAAGRMSKKSAPSAEKKASAFEELVEARAIELLESGLV